MNKYIFSVLPILLFSWEGGLAQQEVKRDSFPSGPLCEHMYVHVTAQAGGVAIASSNVCGLSFTQSPQGDTTSGMVRTRMHRDGNMLRTINFASSGQQTRQVPEQTQPQNLRIAGRLIGGESSLVGTSATQYHHDPSLSSDLMLEFQEGNAVLDLSGLTLRGVTIRSAFSDVTVDYLTPNQVNMPKFEVHTAKGNIVLNQVELSRAKVVTVKNEMGNTTVSLGPAKTNTSAIYLQNGVGACTLIVDHNKPVKITLQRAIFSSVHVHKADFEEIEDDVYVNQAYKRNPTQATIITCTTDLGDVNLQLK